MFLREVSAAAGTLSLTDRTELLGWGDTVSLKLNRYSTTQEENNSDCRFGDKEGGTTGKF